MLIALDTSLEEGSPAVSKAVLGDSGVGEVGVAAAPVLAGLASTESPPLLATFDSTASGGEEVGGLGMRGLRVSKAVVGDSGTKRGCILRGRLQAGGCVLPSGILRALLFVLWRETGAGMVLPLLWPLSRMSSPGDESWNALSPADPGKSQTSECCVMEVI